MTPKWFVIWEGDLETDPLDCGVRHYEYGTQASKFVRRMENKGYTCTVYFGELSTMFHSIKKD